MDNQYYLFAGDDIYEEERILYLKDELIGSISILKKTKNVKNILPKGTYYISHDKEIENQIYVEERLESWQYFENILLLRQTISLDLKVIDKQKNKVIEGVHCGLFAKEDIYDKNDCLVYFQDDLVIDVYSRKDDIIQVPLLNINEGTFYIQQMNTVDGYYGNTQQFIVKMNIDLGLDKFRIRIENQPTMVEISKKNEIDEYVEGAWLALYDEKGKLTDEWVSEREHIVYNLSIGHRYVIEEKQTPEGYKKADITSFVVENRKGIQKITVINEREVMN